MNIQTAKLIAAGMLALLIATFLVGISYYLIPEKEVLFPSPSDVFLNISFSINLPRITIATDGAITPDDAPITQKGNVYSFTSDIFNYTLEIQKDDIIIDGGGHFFAVYINGSRVFGDYGIILSGRKNVTIRNVCVEKYWQGIVAQNCSGLTIESAKISEIGSSAITIADSNDIIIRENSINGVGRALDVYTAPLDQALKLTITENTIISATAGIQLHSGLCGVITKNSFNAVYTPIWVASNSTIISDNILSNGIDGIVIGGKYSINENSSGGSNCIIFGNRISNFTESGISFSIGVNNIIYQNNIIDNKYGIAINLGGDASGAWIVENNTIYHNNFINNMYDVFIGGACGLNYWDNGKEGNYWSKIAGSDVDKDGRSDTPYVICANNIDRYPLMDPYGNPEIQQPLSSQMFALYVAVGLAFSVAVMAGAAVYTKKRKK